MARGNVMVDQAVCEGCGLLGKFEKNAMEWGAGDLILVVATLLLWVPAKFAIDAVFNPWRCSKCGGRRASS